MTETPIPIKKGEQLIIRIEDEGQKGDGITKVDNFVIITRGAKQNKKYEVEIRNIYPKFAFAKIIREIKGDDDKCNEKK